MHKDIKDLKHMLKVSKNIVFFTGAGVSTDSGIPDYRSIASQESNNYKGYTYQQILNIQFFIENPTIFYEYYHNTRATLGDKLPNLIHAWMSSIEKNPKKLVTTITQNIDGLHGESGCENLIELHGSIFKNYCIECKTGYPLEFILKQESIPRCLRCNGIIRPGIVMFGEDLGLGDTKKATDAISGADLLIIAGSSLAVYPAAGLIKKFRGKYMVILNNTETDFDKYADLIINRPLKDVVKEITKESTWSQIIGKIPII